MELDTIKATWQSLDDRLRKQESIKETILKELIQSKGNRALSKLYNHEWFGLLLTILVSPLIPIVLCRFYNTFSILSVSLLVIFGILVFASIGFQAWKVWTLDAIDFSKKIEENIKLMNKYNLFIKKEKILAVIVFVLLFIFYISRVYLDNAMPNSINVFIYFFMIAVGILICIWQYKKLYAKNIDSIQKSLDELKELEEE